MKAIKTDTTNCILKGDGDKVYDLPVTSFQYSDGVPAVESCWVMRPLERLKVLLTGKVYFTCLGQTHPPVLLTAEPKYKPEK